MKWPGYDIVYEIIVESIVAIGCLLTATNGEGGIRMAVCFVGFVLYGYSA